MSRIPPISFLAGNPILCTSSLGATAAEPGGSFVAGGEQPRSSERCGCVASRSSSSTVSLDTSSRVDSGSHDCRTMAPYLAVGRHPSASMPCFARASARRRLYHGATVPPWPHWCLCREDQPRRLCPRRQHLARVLMRLHSAMALRWDVRLPSE